MKRQKGKPPLTVGSNELRTAGPRATDTVVHWTRPMLDRFVQVYKASGEYFTFEGNEYYRPYAKYLIEYLDGVLPK